MLFFRTLGRVISFLSAGPLFLLLVFGNPGAQAGEEIAPHPEALSLQESFVRIAEDVAPAVVNLGTSRGTQHPDTPGLPQPSPRDYPRRGTGSGIIFDSRGYILTNNHVVQGAGRIRVLLLDGREYFGETVGTDPRTDLAVVRIHPKGAPLPVAHLGDSDQLRKGQWAIAIGHPFGLERTVTVGVVSGIGRSGMGITHYENFIQTDAAISPGNSGGPLINLDGEVIGINTAVLVRGGGIGFAIPINMARQVAESLIADGRVVRGFLGVLIQSVTPEIAGKFHAPEPRGALVGDVLEDGPAAQAGIQQGDVIWNYDGTPVKDVPALQRLAAATPPGNRVTLTVLRQGQPERLEVIMAELEEDGRPSERIQPVDAPPAEYGLSVEGLTDQEAARLHEQATDTTGVRVSTILPNSGAAFDGLRVGDIISRVEGATVSNEKEFRDALAEAPMDVLVLVNRGGRNSFMILHDPR